MNYEVGDKVRIIKRVGDGRNYPFSFTDSMADKAGKIYEIESIESAKDPKCDINGDFHLYHLKGDAWAYNWHSSMFELFEELPILKVGDAVRITSEHVEFADNTYEDKLVKPKCKSTESEEDFIKIIL